MFLAINSHVFNWKCRKKLISSKKTQKKKNGDALNIYNLRYYRSFLTEKWLCYNQKCKNCQKYWKNWDRRIRTWHPHITSYRYTNSWYMNRNRTALYPFTNMLTVDIPTFSRAPKGVWNVPGWWCLEFQFYICKIQKVVPLLLVCQLSACL